MLEARGVSVKIGSQVILDGVDLDVAVGSVTAILGPSGAGKTTLFRVLVGELAPDSGVVRLGGEDVTRLPLWERARRGLGYVPQGAGILGDLTVADNVRTFERAARRPQRPLADRAAIVGLEHRLTVRARDLSGGEQRRLALLRALIGEPRQLVVDEPFAGVDPSAADHLVELLRERASAGCGILLADHRAREALAVADDVALLVDGRVEVRLEPGAFARHPTVRQRYMV